MGKTTGFLEFERCHEAVEPTDARIRHYREFVLTLSRQETQTEGARCMACGIPFCNTGCPVHNLIPDFNDLVYRRDWRAAIDALHATNNFPEFTGRVCPAPCEAACTLNINDTPVGIKSVERAIIDQAWDEDWVTACPPARRTGKKVAIVGSGPAGLACAQQLARAGHQVTVFEKNDRIGGLLRYGIPDFKLNKHLIDRRIRQMEAEGVVFRTGVAVGLDPSEMAQGMSSVTPEQLSVDFDAIVVTIGAEVPRDLLVPGRSLKGIHFAMEFLTQQNRRNAGERRPTLDNPLTAAGQHVVVIGGGDTGSDCVGTANRHGARCITQLELMYKPPVQEDKLLIWPYWPLKLRTSSSHEEGCERDWAVVTKRFEDRDGKVERLIAARLEWQTVNGIQQPCEIPGSEFEIQADLVLLAMGFTSPVSAVLDAFGIAKDARGNARADSEGARAFATSADKVFVAGDARRGQSLVVWAIREGRECAQAVDQYLDREK